MNIGEIFKHRRKELGLSQREVAKEAGITQATLCQIERGQREPYEKTIKAIVRVLNVDLSKIGYQMKDVKQPIQIGDNQEYLKRIFKSLNRILKDKDAEIASLKKQMEEAQRQSALIKNEIDLIKPLIENGGIIRDE